MFQVRFRSDQSDEQPQPGQMSQVEGQMTKPGGQIDQQGGQIGQDVNPWPLLHSQIPGETIEEAQETK